MRSTTSASCSRTASSGSAGPGLISTRCCFSASIRFGAFSAPTTGNGSGFSARSSSRVTSVLISSTKISGANSGPVSNVLITVRRSRRFSRTSLRNTVAVAFMTFPENLALALKASCSQSFFAADQLDERVFEVRLAGLRAQRVRRRIGDDAAPGDYDDAVAQRGDLLHDVAREQHAAALAAQALEELAHRPRGHDVEAVGRLVEDDVARI